MNRKILCLVLTVMIGALYILSGCDKPNALPEKKVKPPVIPGGQIIYGSLSEPDLLNPYLTDLVASLEVCTVVFSGLVKADDQLQWTPDLAVEVPTVANGRVSPDGLRVTYRLRPGVKWHDGTSLTAADIKFTWQMIMNPRLPVLSREGYDKIKSVDIPDPYTVVVTFKEVYAPYLTLFPYILPKHLLEREGDIAKAAFNRNPVGSGPFKLAEWSRGEGILLAANPEYHLGKPTLDTLYYRVVPEASMLLAQLRAGEVDVAGNVPPDVIDQVKAIAHIETFIVPSMVWEQLTFNLTSPVFQDVRVRRAISLGIDRQALAGTVLRGFAIPAASDQHPQSWAFYRELAMPQRDVVSAKMLLTQAGWQVQNDGIAAKDGKRLTFSLITTTGNKNREAVQAAIQQQLREIGIDVQIRNVDAVMLFGDMLQKGHFDTALYGWVLGFDPNNRSLWHSKSIPAPVNNYQGHNYSRWMQSEADSLVDQGERTADMERRKPLYARLQQLLAEDAPVVPLYFRANVSAANARVAMLKPHPSPVWQMWNVWQWGLTQKK